MIYHRARSGKRKILIPTTGQRAKRRRLNPFNVDVPFNVKDVSDAFKKANALQKVGSAPPSTKPDYYCPVANKCEVYNNYRCVLNLTQIEGNVNKFCVMQMLKTYQHHYNFYVWSRCGRVGERGTMLLKGPMSEMRAAMDFTKRFGRKTGRRWADREKDETTDTEVHEEDDFLPRKFANIDVVDFADKMMPWSKSSIIGHAFDKTLNWMQHTVSTVGTSKKTSKITMPCAECLARLASSQQSSAACTKCLTLTIDKGNNCDECIKELGNGATPYESCARCLFKFSVNNDLYERMRKDLQYGDARYSPLGRLTKQQLTRGVVLLTHIEDALRDGASSSSLSFLSSLFYTQIPHDFARRTPPVINDLPLLVKELGILITFYMLSPC
ncbi:hypothetical protein LSAT2_011841 [Lamellibrachia satsuma]|nr:hypothetical protein LSAT2_011841 [Lamellibrachia satsuma]